MTEELIKVLDDNMSPIGVATRRQVHAEGYWHETFACWVVARDNGKEYLLFQRRSGGKELCPNLLDITASGHLHYDEDVTDGVRELEEELGVRVEFVDLIPLGVTCGVIKVGDIMNREFCYSFLLENSQPLSMYVPQAEEVEGLLRIEVNEGISLFTGKVSSISALEYVVAGGQPNPVPVSVTTDSFVPRIGRFYLKIFNLARRYFSGETDTLAI